ncbi:hypothetical protein Tco_1283393 [Tanacetum coccineum]
MKHGIVQANGDIGKDSSNPFMAGSVKFHASIELTRTVYSLKAFKAAHLKLGDHRGINFSSTTEIFAQTGAYGLYATIQSPQPPSPQPSPPQTSPTPPCSLNYHPPTPMISPLMHVVHSHGLSMKGSFVTPELMTLVTTFDRLEARRHSRFVLRIAEMILPNRGAKFSKDGFKLDEEWAVGNLVINISTVGRNEIEERCMRNLNGSYIKIARDAEIARQWDEEERKRVMDEAKATKKIDWNDPSVLRYHSLKLKPKSIAQARRNMVKYLKNQGNFKMTDFKGMSYNEVRPVFEKIWDFNQKFVPLDTENASKKQKSPVKEKSPEKIMKEKAATQEKKEEVPKEPTAKRKKSIPRKTTRKRQKLEDVEEDELKGFLDVVPREETPIEIESLSTKFPIVDWKTVVLTETFMYYQVFRGDGSSKKYKILWQMLLDL